MPDLDFAILGDIGNLIEVTMKRGGVVFDIQTATTKQIHFRRPDKSTFIRTASFITNGTDGGLKYTIVAGDLDQAGEWGYMPYIITPTFTGHGTMSLFEVYPAI